MGLPLTFGASATSTPVMAPRTLPALLPAFFRANWLDAVRITTVYNTSVARSPISLAEERLGLSERPVRTVEALLNGYTRDDTRELLFAAMRWGTDPMPFPLYSDLSFLTATSSTGSGTLWCNTVSRRFYSGQRIAVIVLDADATRIGSIDFYEISDASDAVKTDRLTLKTALTTTYSDTQRTIIFPMIDVQLSAQQRMRLHTDSKVGIAFKVQEDYGFSALPPTVNDGDQSPFSTIFSGVPVFDSAYQWARNLSVRIVRQGRKASVGRGNYVFGDGDRPILEFDLRFLHATREEWYSLMQVFDYCQGRLRPVFLTNPGTILEVQEADPDWIQIEKIGTKTDYTEFLDYLSVKQTDGTAHVRKLLSIEDTGDDPTVPAARWRLNFTTPITGLSTVNTFSATSAHLVRFKRDALVEQWQSPAVCSMSSSFTELVEEESVTITNITPTFPTFP
jgi:hypothetical protein